jgi:hypothetical protein
MKDICQRKHSLSDEVAIAADIYTNIMAALTDQIGKGIKLEYSKLKTAEIARKLNAQLRTELDDHVAMHGC